MTVSPETVVNGGAIPGQRGGVKASHWREKGAAFVENPGFCEKGSDSHLMILHGGVLFSEGISTMVRNLRLSFLIPAQLVVDAIAEGGGVIAVTARAGVPARPRPISRRVSRLIHSPLSSTSVGSSVHRDEELHLVARRFICDAALPWTIFAERFDDSSPAERSLRTSRLERIVHHLGLVLGCRPAASFAKRLMVRVSMTHCSERCGDGPVNKQIPSKGCGIDDCAYRGSHR